jgi:cytoskeletal protein CcmA (bactofilin family)
MAKNTSSTTPPEAVISIIGAGMSIDGDSETDGSLRIEGTIRGSVRAGKSVVVGRDGLVDGSIYTQDAVISGRVSGGIHAVSRLELLATSEVSGEIEAPRMQVEEGAKVQGQVTVGEVVGGGAPKAAKSSTSGGDEKTKAKSEPQFKGSDDVAPEPEEPEPEEVEPVETEAGEPEAKAENQDTQLKGSDGVGGEQEKREAVRSEQSRD